MSNIKRTFASLIDMAQQIAEINPKGLHDFIKAILRPLQSEYLLALIERGPFELPAIESTKFFGEFVQLRLDEYKGWEERSLPGESFVINLGTDVVLPCPWGEQQLARAIAAIGSKKRPKHAIPHDWSNGYKGAWEQDDNHRIELWLPWGIGFVHGGNHSITAGILAGEGAVVPYRVYDMTRLLNDVRCDGEFFYDEHAGVKIAPVQDARRAAVFEIGRIMIKRGCPAFKR